MRPEAVFTIQQKPDGKWRLTKGMTSMGIFDSQTEAVEGMMRIINPIILRYDEKGEIIK